MKKSGNNIPSNKLYDPLKWYKLALLSRKIDTKAAIYIRQGKGWSYHARCAGHEGIQIALGSHFRPNIDFLFPYYRDTATVIAAGLTPYELVLNGLSKEGDVASGGRHMSNHFAKPSINIQNTSSCTGNHTLHAVGLARAIKYYEKDAIAFASLGEAAMSEGYCYEAINGASREKLPVIFVIQNNGYGISAPVSVQSANSDISDNFKGFRNLGIYSCDGVDFFASFHAMDQAIAFVKKHGCPALLHAQVTRIGAHSNSDAHDLYRDQQEILLAESMDPIAKLKSAILEQALASMADLSAIAEEVDHIVEEACLLAEKQSSPNPSLVSSFLYAKEYEAQEQDVINNVSDQQEKLREAITRTLKEEFRHNPHTFLWGQDVASKKKGGVFNLTKGLLEEFGDKRIFNAPLAEDYIVGTANGMSRFNKDIRIVIEAAQFADYVWPAMEQIVEMGHDYWRSFGQFSPNVVLRLASGGYINGGLYHSQNVEAIMSHLPGIRVVYPSFADDASGLLRTAIRSEGPTFFLEPKYLYNRLEAQSYVTDSNFAIPFGKGRIRKHGDDMSIISYGNTLHICLEVAHDLAKEGHSIEVFDIRSIKPLDEEGICHTAQKTGKVLIVHEDHGFNGIGGHIASLIMEHCFTDLDAPIKRVCAKDIPIGFAKVLEQAILPQKADINHAVLDLLHY